MATSRVLLALVLAGGAGSAMAHGGHAGGHFAAGLAHPFGGVDHLLAMLAVGVYATRQSGRARWGLPLGFVVAMLCGAGLAALGVVLPAVEGGIGVSVLVMGLLIALAVKLPVSVALPLVGVFALFHGYAHVADMGGASLLSYVVGFVVATAVLHGAGYALGGWMPASRVAMAVKRVLGGVMAGVGLVLLGT
ncbi:HupE/UreJ family protein [Denitromonas ohlonensis]|uniref:HupE/UreJ family protein n=2 Tax=Denitromonas TaxID=139331 RepID=A0A558EQ99_9RHOO|nr:HupE/UreJ family protein [Denitromonas ohlonensis]TVO68742.1 HupE/UreJ family protein [Denitromonas ohlonensis]TVO72892.1 HupE/UreJ family protein [Denitromonas ohlonensis]TVT49525.1 MAG: HupE/UreJ family protein [Denitromonas halophila]TVT75323.1 MAG: HupE/UreJ family protein [Denitromonas halophila]